MNEASSPQFLNEASSPQFQNEASAPRPVVEATFHVEPHPDPVVRALIAEVERLRAELEREKAMKEIGPHTR